MKRHNTKSAPITASNSSIKKNKNSHQNLKKIKNKNKKSKKLNQKI
jgi:hypothetical protein